MKYRGYGALTAGLFTLSIWTASILTVQAQTVVTPFITSYRPDFFTSSHPSSAYQMVGLLPSFQLVEGDAKVRGYAGRWPPAHQQAGNP